MVCVGDEVKCPICNTEGIFSVEVIDGHIVEDEEENFKCKKCNFKTKDIEIFLEGIEYKPKILKLSDAEIKSLWENRKEKLNHIFESGKEELKNGRKIDMKIEVNKGRDMWDKIIEKWKN
jgi:hypothetical protein